LQKKLLQKYSKIVQLLKPSLSPRRSLSESTEEKPNPVYAAPVPLSLTIWLLLKGLGAL